MHCVHRLLENEIKKVFVNFLTDIEAQIREIQGKKAALDEAQGVGLDSTGYYDQEIYGGSDSRFAGYVTSIAATELEDVSYKICKSQAFFVGEQEMQRDFLFGSSPGLTGRDILVFGRSFFWTLKLPSWKCLVLNPYVKTSLSSKAPTHHLPL